MKRGIRGLQGTPQAGHPRRTVLRPSWLSMESGALAKSAVQTTLTNGEEDGQEPHTVPLHRIPSASHVTLDCSKEKDKVRKLKDRHQRGGVAGHVTR